MSNANFVSQQTAIKKYLNTPLLLTNSTPQGHLRSCSHHYSNRNRHSYMNVAFYTSTFRLQIIFQPVRQACSPLLAKKNKNKADDCCPNGSLTILKPHNAGALANAKALPCHSSPPYTFIPPLYDGPPNDYMSQELVYNAC